ncbi:MAG TPA: RluA family pseudouridine synthase [Polyangiaceae bacterium]
MQRRVWVIGPKDGASLAAIVAKAGGDAEAIRDGRVFIGKNRAISDRDAIAVGDKITITLAAARAADVDVLHHGDGLVVVAKPAGISTIPDQSGGEGTLIARAASAIGKKPSDLHPTSRLDREVSGVVVFATSKRAADALLEARANGAYARRYVAIADRAPSPPVGRWNAAIGRAKDPKLRAAFAPDETRFEAKKSETVYRVVAEAHERALLAVAPVTGRTHQIRVHASHGGAPLLGDKAYGGPHRLVVASGKIVQIARICLHCAWVEIPKAGKIARFSAPVPAELASTWTALGGDAASWDTALACELSLSSD